MHESSMARVRQFIDDHLADRRGIATRIVDLGSQDVNGSYRTLFDDPAWTYVGIDLAPGSGVDLVLEAPYALHGVATRSVEVVVSGQAFEHIEFPWVSILEVTRVLKPGGLACLVVPSNGPEHRYPVDCWRFFPDGMAALAAWADLEVLEAVTHWSNEAWPDDSDQWHDSVLIARRPTLGMKAEWLGRAKRSVLKTAGAWQANRRSTDLASRRDQVDT